MLYGSVWNSLSQKQPIFQLMQHPPNYQAATGHGLLEYYVFKHFKLYYEIYSSTSFHTTSTFHRHEYNQKTPAADTNKLRNAI